MRSFSSTFNRRQLTYLRDLLLGLVVRDIKLRYKRSLLGVAWSLLVPLAQLLVLYFVFRLVLPLNIPNYTTFLFTGILPWTWFQTSLLAASIAIVDNRDLVKQVGFPVSVLPIISVTSQLIHFLLALPILFAFVLLDGYGLTAAILALPLVILLQYALTLSLAYLAACFQVTFQDTQYLVGLLLFLFFYLTPVFYEASLIPERYQPLYNLNPMVHIIGAYRSILIAGEVPFHPSLLAVVAGSAVSLYLGYLIFMRMHFRFVEEL